MDSQKWASFARLLLLTIGLPLLLSLGGCAWWKDLWDKKRVGGTAEAIYQAGVSAYQEGRYKRAVEHFSRVKEQFPLHPLALMAEIGIADAHYSNEEYAEAELAYTDFINLHPTNEHVPYAIYQLGMCHYNQMQSIDRDQTETHRAAKEFERLITRYPSSKFAFMAEKKLRECRQRLAESEFYVGEFYFKQGKYKAALKRFEYLAKTYPNVGLEYKTGVYLKATRERLARQEAQEAEKEKAKKEKTKPSAPVKDGGEEKKDNALKPPVTDAPKAEEGKAPKEPVVRPG
ncbi:MAG: outer membrane protein assembly factor BamD, partial [Syntrophales bacterium]|nr:outer membrane protein assembly factor BamD [Syntrophales bacterium]